MIATEPWRDAMLADPGDWMAIDKESLKALLDAVDEGLAARRRLRSHGAEATGIDGVPGAGG